MMKKGVTNMNVLLLVVSLLSFTNLLLQLVLRLVFKKEIRFMKHNLIKLIDLNEIGRKRLIKPKDIFLIMMNIEIYSYLYPSWVELFKWISITFLLSLTLNEIVQVNQKHNKMCSMWIARFTLLLLIVLLTIIVLKLFQFI
jgi:hypothetical protein